MARIVILGGGFGGIVAATELRSRLGGEHRITLIERSKDHVYKPSLPWLVVGERASAQIARDFSALVRQGIQHLHAEVISIDTANKTVTTTLGETPYDYLVIALGADLAKGVIPNQMDAINFYCLKGAEVLRRELERFSGGTIAMVVASTPFRCPIAPYEMALLIEAYVTGRGLRSRTEIAVYTPETLPMPVAGPATGNTLKDLLISRGISFHPQRTIVSIDDMQMTFNTGERVKADVIPFVPPHVAPACVAGSGLSGESGWIPVDGKTMKTGASGVYAIGDVTENRLPSGMMLPKAGVFAHFQAEVVAHNIAAEINGSKTSRQFDGAGTCIIEMGHGLAGLVSGSFYAEPRPEVTLSDPGRFWHWSKAAFEKWWLWKWF